MASSSPNYLDHIPAVAAPAGQTSNLVDPPNKYHALSIVDSVFVTLMLLAVLVRVFVRARLIKNWGWDDVACAIAALGSLTHTISYTQMARVGFGRHLWDIPVSWLLSKSNVQLLSANGVTYPVTVFSAKLSILLLYFRIFSINRALRIVVYVTVLIMALFYMTMIGLGIGSIIKCSGITDGTTAFCESISGPVVLANGSFGAITDFFIFFLPFPMLAKLQLRFRKKLALGIVFATGLVACAASLARLISFAVNYSTSDSLWVNATLSIYTSVEINVGIIVACVSCFPTFYAHSKVYLDSTTTTIRQRLLTSRGTPPHTKGASAITLARDKTRSIETEDRPFIELRETLPTKHAGPHALEPRTESQAWA